MNDTGKGGCSVKWELKAYQTKVLCAYSTLLSIMHGLVMASVYPTAVQ